MFRESFLLVWRGMVTYIQGRWFILGSAAWSSNLQPNSICFPDLNNYRLPESSVTLIDMRSTLFCLGPFLVQVFSAPISQQLTKKQDLGWSFTVYQSADGCTGAADPYGGTGSVACQKGVIRRGSFGSDIKGDIRERCSSIFDVTACLQECGDYAWLAELVRNLEHKANYAQLAGEACNEQ